MGRRQKSTTTPLRKSRPSSSPSCSSSRPWCTSGRTCKHDWPSFFFSPSVPCFLLALASFLPTQRLFPLPHSLIHSPRALFPSSSISLTRKYNVTVNQQWLTKCRNSKYKGWRISFALPWGGLLFISGFIMHVISIYHDRDVGIFIAWNVLILCAW